MYRTWTKAFFIISVIFLSGTAAGRRLLPDYQGIQMAYHEGELSSRQYVETIVTAIRQREDLDDQWLIESINRNTCLTMIIKEIREIAGGDPELECLIEEVTARQDMQKSIQSPEGFFTIHYDTVGTHIVYEPDIDIDPSDGVPDFVNRCAEACDIAWHVEIDSLGFDPPSSDEGLGGSDNYDVYMFDNGWWGMEIADAPAPDYPERPRAWYSHIVVNPTFDFESVEHDSCRVQALRVTTAHEFHHALQDIYDYAELKSVMEQTSVWMENVVWDETYCCAAYWVIMHKFLHNPHRYLYTYDVTGDLFSLGACAWPHYLEHNFGRDIMRQVWEECIPVETNAIHAYETVLQNQGTSHAQELPEFRVWNYYIGDRDDGNHYEEGSYWPGDTLRIMAEYSDYPVIHATPAANQSPQGTACNYIEFTELEDINHLRIDFTDENSTVRDWTVNLIKWHPDSSEVIPMTLEDGAGENIVFTDDHVKVVMVPTCTEVITSDLEYSYSAFADEYVLFEDMFVEDRGDGDGRMEPGETFGIGASFYNIAAEWGSTALSLSTDDPYITIDQDQVIGGPSSPGESFEFPAGSILISIAADLPKARMATIEFHVGPAVEDPIRSFSKDILLGIPSHLIVDDDGGQALETYITNSLDSQDRLYDIWDDHSGMFPDYPLADLEMEYYDSTLIWITGDAGNHLQENDIVRIEEFLGNGGHLLLSGQDIAESLATNPEGIEFLANVLGVEYNGYESSHLVRSADGDLVFNGKKFVTSGLGMDGANNQNSQDRLVPFGDSRVCLDYQSGHPAAICREWRSGRLIFAGFGIEAVVDDNSNFETRRYFLERAIWWLSVGIDEEPLPSEFEITSVWPNPSSGIFYSRIANPAVIARMRFYLVDLAGRRIADLNADVPRNMNETNITFRIPDSVSNGIYLLRVVNPETSRMIPVTIIR